MLKRRRASRRGDADGRRLRRSLRRSSLNLGVARERGLQRRSLRRGRYRGLFGPFGWLAPVITAALVIYVAVYAYQLITGRGSLSVSTLTGRFIAIGVVVAFASNWAAYQTAFVDVFFRGGDELAGMILRATSSDASLSGSAVSARLDAVFEELTRLASTWGHRAPLQTVDQALSQTAAQAPVATAASAGWTGGSVVNMLWFSAIAFALGSAGVIIIAKIALGFLLALGPLFILLALFPQTRGLFEGWLRAAAANLLIPLMATLATAGALPIVEPLVAGVSLMQARGEIDNEPVFLLAICALIFAGLVAYSVAMSGKLVAAWRLPAPPFT
ncbi:MAG: type IV secretion system protein, partial [Rhodomicrobium sp.]|nr:type IV secretion system protein [Rhodomicrobium sp.]